MGLEVEMMSNETLAVQAPEPVAKLHEVRVELKRRSRYNQVLNGIDLEIGRGEIVALVGESGSGKSVLGMTILGLLPSKATPKISGTVRVLDVEINSASEKSLLDLRKHHLGAVFQDPMSSLNPSMKILRQLDEVTKDTQLSTQALLDVGITNAKEILNRYPFELSGGQRQRVMIAMALAKSPALIVVDEPTTALDVTVQAQILQLIRDLRDRIGTAFLFVTHDLGVASDIADRIVVMLAGRILESGTTSNILRSGQHPYTRSLLASRITMAQDKGDRIFGKELPNSSGIVNVDGCPWVERCNYKLDICNDVFPDPVLLSKDWNAFCHNLGAVAIQGAVSGSNAQEDKVVENNAVPDLAMSPVVLEVIALEKVFVSRSGSARKEFTALKNVDLELRKGECVAVVGESGSGKSTLLRIIGGLETPTSGEVFNHTKIVPRMVYQDAGSSLTPWMSVDELLTESLLVTKLSRNEVKRRVAEVIHHVNLPEAIGTAKTAALSGGQKQRVAIARCVIDPPTILLCDEPTSALDASLVGNTLNLLNDLKRELEMAMVFVTHDLAVARYIADRIVVMYKGRIVEVGDSKTLCHSPLHPYTKMLLASLPGTNTLGQEFATDNRPELGESSGCSFAQRCGEAIDICFTNPVSMHYMDDGRHASCHLLASGGSQ